jgi:hypothetical protein
MAPRTIVAGLGLALTLAACGGGEPTSQGTGTPTATARPLVSAFPVIGGYAHGKEVNYLLQEISKPDVAELMSEKTGLEIPVVASLANVPRKALGDLYLFMNGVSGPNPFGFQKNVIDSVPGEPGYSPLWLHTFVKWAEGKTPRELTSEEAIIKAAKDGEVTLEKTDLVINCPVLPDGETNFPVVSGYAHGKPVDYLLQEISAPDVTKLMRDKTGFAGLATVTSLADVPGGSLADLYLFMNGIKGPNPFGFQKNVIDSVTGEPGYSPLWRHTFVKWTDGVTPRELKSEEEILAASQAGDVTLEASKLVINCPVIPASIQR